MFTYSFFIAATFFFIWYSYKLIRDVSGVDQYWHIPQTLFLVVVWLMPLSVTFSWLYLFRAVCWGLMFPFLFNTGLNLYRINSGTNITWKHLGKYDFLNWGMTVVMFIGGLLAIITYEIFGNG